MSKAKCGFGWEKKFWVEGNLESVLAVNEAVMAVERVRHLLARIHGDGGHHTETVGIIQSIQDAEELFVDILANLKSLELEFHNTKGEL